MAAIELKSTVNLSDSGGTYTTIGISDALTLHSMAEILDFIYCSASTDFWQNPKAETTGIYSVVSRSPYVFSISGTSVLMEPGDEGYSVGLYGKIVWLYGNSLGTFVNPATNNACIVTNMDVKKFVMYIANQVNTSGSFRTYWGNDWQVRQAESWSDVGKAFDLLCDIYFQDNGGENFKDISIVDTHRHGTDGKIKPYIILPALNGTYYFASICDEYHHGSSSGYLFNTSDQLFDALRDSSSNKFSWSPNGIPIPDSVSYWQHGMDYYGIYANSLPYSIDFHSGKAWNAYSPLTLKCVPNTLDSMNKIKMMGGIWFYTDKLYKPIIVDGYVTGYGDPTAESDYDNYSYNKGNQHDVPPTPPGPTPPGPGYDDDPWNGATFAGTGVGGAGAFAKVYYMTSTELANLRSWMNSINVPEGFDPMEQIIGLSQVPVALSGSGPENVVFVNSSAVYDPGVTTRAVDTGVATQQAMGTPISYYLGSVDIVRRMQERGEPYLDYDCQIELYLPLIGMFSLDTQAVMGRTISAYAVLDPVSGTLAAYAYVTKDGQNLPIAYGSTTIGVDLPISAQQLSVSRAALKQANAQLGASLLSGALTMLAAASSGKASGTGAKTSTGSSGLSAAGIREAGSDYMKASQVGNVFGDFMNWGRTIRQLSYGNNTAIAGSFGGSTAQWSYPFTPYVKIIRPRYEKPSNYNHSQGVPCVQTKTIGSCTGFIQCIGADVSGITGATDLELQAIQAALSNGIYAGGGS